MWWLVFAVFFLNGCSFFATSQETPLQLDFTKVLPEGWTAIGTWQEVNVDGDQETEYLLLFAYDNGQVGAVIYDPQIAVEIVGMTDRTTTPVPVPTVEIVTIPLQPFGYFKPYRLLPSYWAYTYGSGVGQGFVAAPPDAGKVVVTEVRVTDGALNASEEVVDEGGGRIAAPSAELLLKGGDTHLTFVWWKDIYRGYGVTQLYAPGGFRGMNWQKWQEAPTPITSISGLYPLADYQSRSLLCRELLYTRVLTPTSEIDEGQASVTFRQEDSGLQFCEDKIPEHPFYPEGVVMAYLLSAGADRDVLTALITPGVSGAQIDADLDLSRLAHETISDIATHPTIPVAPGAVQEGRFSPTTTVCVELSNQAGDNRTRWMVFTLKYQPPDLQRRLPDRWTISGTTPAPAPINATVPGYCQTILSRGSR